MVKNTTMGGSLHKIKILPQERIYPLYKAAEPFMSALDGHGYFGVLLYDSWEDKVQCHMCGKWFKLLSAHINQAHKVNTDYYRERFGFGKHLGLCSLGLSKRHSELIKTNKGQKENFERNIKGSIQSRLNYGDSDYKKRIGELIKKSRKVMSYRNKISACDEQIRSRFRVIQQIVKKVPSLRDINKYDPSLHRLIRTYFGGIQNLQKSLGVDTYKTGVKIRDIDLIASMRNYVIKNKSIPTSYRKVLEYSSETYKNHFGSWRKAVEIAGLHQLLSEVSGTGGITNAE